MFIYFWGNNLLKRSWSLQARAIQNNFAAKQTNWDLEIAAICLSNKDAYFIQFNFIYVISVMWFWAQIDMTTVLPVYHFVGILMEMIISITWLIDL